MTLQNVVNLIISLIVLAEMFMGIIVFNIYSFETSYGLYYSEYEVSMLSIRTDRQTDTHTQTDRQTDETKRLLTRRWGL